MNPKNGSFYNAGADFSVSCFMRLSYRLVDPQLRQLLWQCYDEIIDQKQDRRMKNRHQFVNISTAEFRLVLLFVLRCTIMFTHNVRWPFL